MSDVLDTTQSKTTTAGTAYTNQYLYPDGSTERACVTYRDDLGPTDPVTALVLFHGFGGNETNFALARYQAVRDTILDDGRFLVVQSNGQGKNCGNDAGSADYLAALDYAQRTFNVTDVITMGESMGGLLAALATVDNDWPTIAGVTGFSPVCDLEEFFAHSTDFADAIQAAYSFTGAYDDVATDGHDPVHDFIATEYPTTTRWRLYASPGDPIVPKVDHSDALVTLVTGRAPEALVVPCTGGHLSSDHFRPDDLMWFFERCIDDVTGQYNEPPPPGGLPTGSVFIKDGDTLRSARIYVRGPDDTLIPVSSVT